MQSIISTSRCLMNAADLTITYLKGSPVPNALEHSYGTRQNSDLEWAWMVPFGAILAYPHLLAYFYTRIQGRHVSAALAAVAMVLTFSVSMLAVDLRLGNRACFL